MGFFPWEKVEVVDKKPKKKLKKQEREEDDREEERKTDRPKPTNKQAGLPE
jgi:hypothetical protein